MATAPAALDLLLDPRESLAVLEYVLAHPQPSPTAACAALHISHHTWYPALARLDGLGLILIDSQPGGRKVRRIEVTPRGRAVLKLLEGLPNLIAGTRLALERELEGRRRHDGTPETGELLLRLIEYAERRGDFAALDRLVERAKEVGRIGEAAFAKGLTHFLQGDPAAARGPLRSALAMLEGEQSGRSYRRALYYHAFNLDALGEGKAAFEAFTRARQLAMAAGDAATEADARFGIGILKARRRQFADAVKALEKALACAREAGLAPKEAKILTSLCSLSFFTDEARGLAYSEDALKIANKLGLRVLLVHIHANRAVMFAVLERKREALAELKLMRGLAAQTGYERGGEVLDAWVALVRRILRRRRPASRADWRNQVLRLLETPPSPRREARPARRRGRGPSRSG